MLPFLCRNVILLHNALITSFFCKDSKFVSSARQNCLDGNSRVFLWRSSRQVPDCHPRARRVRRYSWQGNPIFYILWLHVVVYRYECRKQRQGITRPEYGVAKNTIATARVDGHHCEGTNGAPDIAGEVVASLETPQGRLPVQ